MRGISWLAAKTGQLLKRDTAPWSRYMVYMNATMITTPTASTFAKFANLQRMMSYSILVEQLILHWKDVREFDTGDFYYNL
jgi:hypothetical protein